MNKLNVVIIEDEIPAARLRLRYPAVLQTNNLEGYNQALERLGGPNMTTTSLWWNMK